MKLITVAVILLVALSCVCADRKSDEAEANVDIANTNPETEKTEETVNDTVSVKTKRGILNYGYGHAHAYGHAYPHAHAHVHGVNYAVPSSYAIGLHGAHRNVLATPYAKIPGVYKNVYTHNPVALSHGSASVHSYSASYPRIPIIAAKPVHHHHHVSVARPQLVPVPHFTPLIPSPTVVVPQRPIIPVAYPHVHRVPIYVQRPVQPVVYQQRPVTPVVFQRPAVSAVAPVPFLPTAPIGHVHSFAHNPHVYNQFAFGGIHPQFIPLAVPQPTPILPSTPIAPEGLPQPGSTIFTNAQPDGWRPIIVTAPIPTAPTNTINRPTISLLPPFFEQAPSTPQGEVQPSGEEPVHTPQPQTPSSLYLSPGEVNQLENGNLGNYQEIAAAQELANSQGKLIR